MTRKDYIALAAALKHECPATTTNWDYLNKLLQWESDVLAIAAVLQANNPHFDRSRFLIAAGYMSEGG